LAGIFKRVLGSPLVCRVLLLPQSSGEGTTTVSEKKKKNTDITVLIILPENFYIPKCSDVTNPKDGRSYKK
jgi:hypothetical protein